MLNERNLYCSIKALLLLVCVFLCPMKLLVPNESAEGGLTDGHYFLACTIVILVSAWIQFGKKGRIIIVLTVVLSLTIIYRDGDLSGFVSQETVFVTVLAFTCCGFSIFSEKNYYFGVIVAGSLLAFLGADLFGRRELSHLSVTCVCLYVAFSYVEWCEKRWEKKRLANKRYYLLRIMPFWLLYFGVMLVMPVSDKPYDWQFVKNAYSNVREVFLQISRNWLDADREDFGFAISGFDGSGMVGGNVFDSGRTVMIIQGQKSLKTNVYLTGKIYDSFDGREWIVTNQSEENDRQLDAFETLYAVSLIDGAGISNYIERTRLSIRYDDFRTEYLFAPLKTIRLQNVEEEQYRSFGGSYLFQEKQGYGCIYNTFFYQMNVDHPMVYELLKKVQEEGIGNDEELLKELQKGYFVRQKYTLTDLDNHRKHICANYSQQEVLSAEVQNWLLDATASAETDIDKLRAIEAALQKLVYTKTPGDLPRDVNSGSAFLDYFLLESKQGYCVHYATAFVLLARAEGIPARYVQGFCVPVNGADEVAVTSDMAHAWPEVYVEHVGWIPFEPTPGYEQIRYTPWEVQVFDQGENGVSLDETKAGISEGDGASECNDVSGNNTEEKQEAVLKEDMIAKEKVTFGRVIRIAGLMLVFALVVSFVVWWVDLILRRRRYKTLSLQERFLFEITSNMRILAALGYGRRDNETLSELRTRAWAIMDAEEMDAKPEFVFMELYEEYLYGEYSVNQEKIDIVTTEKACLMKMLKRWKPFVYWYFKLYYNLS